MCTHRPQEAPPYRWIRNEFRPWDERTPLGLAFLDLPVSRRVAVFFAFQRYFAQGLLAGSIK